MPVEITAALIALAAVVIYAVARVVQRLPGWIERRVDAKLNSHELERDKLRAESIRDRALADAYVSAASSVAQSLTVIQLLASTKATDYADRDMLQRIVIELEKNGRQLKKLNEGIKNDSHNESVPDRAKIIGDAG